MKRFSNWSLRSRIMFSFMGVVLCILFAVSFFFYLNQKNELEKNLIESNTLDLTYLSGNLEKQLRLCEKLSSWIFVNRQIESVLVRDYDTDLLQYSREIPPIQRLLTDQIGSSSIGEYVAFLVINGNNGVELKSQQDSDWLRLDDLIASSWFLEGLKKDGAAVWQGIFENPASFTNSPYIIPIVRPIIFSDTRIDIGWHVIAFNPKLISSVFQDYYMDKTRQVMVLDQNNKAIFHYDNNKIGSQIKLDFYENDNGLGSGNTIVMLDGERTLMSYHRSEYSGMMILITRSMMPVDEQLSFVGRMLVFVVGAASMVFLGLSYYLSYRLAQPLQEILKKMHEASGSPMDKKGTFRGINEMSIIGRGVSEMSSNISSLMEELIQREQEKCELEYRVLLNQINPHFVYNVLNSIKVMADIQKIEGISEMASSLGMLLKEISKGTAEIVTIKRELQLLDSYLYLQKIRRCGMLMVTYDIPDDDVLLAMIPRFTLQPLTENAIYHGLEHMDKMGEIYISIFSEENDILIVIQDNGVGISEEKIAELLEFTPSDGELTHVGLNNINQRIKLFSQTGAVSIESVEGEYTKVCLRFEKKEEIDYAGRFDS